MAYKDMGDLTRAFAKDPGFDEVACKVFLYYISQIANPNAAGCVTKWDLREVLTILEISREAYDKTMQAISAKGFISIEEQNEYQQVIEANLAS